MRSTLLLTLSLALLTACGTPPAGSPARRLAETSHAAGWCAPATDPMIGQPMHGAYVGKELPYWFLPHKSEDAVTAAIAREDAGCFRKSYPGAARVHEAVTRPDRPVWQGTAGELRLRVRRRGTTLLVQVGERVLDLHADERGIGGPADPGFGITLLGGDASQLSGFVLGEPAQAMRGVEGIRVAVGCRQHGFALGRERVTGWLGARRVELAVPSLGKVDMPALMASVMLLVGLADETRCPARQ